MREREETGEVFGVLFLVGDEVRQQPRVRRTVDHHEVMVVLVKGCSSLCTPTTTRSYTVESHTTTSLTSACPDRTVNMSSIAVTDGSFSKLTTTPVMQLRDNHKLVAGSKAFSCQPARTAYVLIDDFVRVGRALSELPIDTWSDRSIPVIVAPRTVPCLSITL